MKKVILSVLAVMTFGFANAQEGNGGFTKGSTFISGAFAIASEKTGEEKSSGFEIEPKIGYFVSENIAIGGKLGYASFKEEEAGLDVADNTALTIGAFGRYYFTPASQFSLFGQLGFDYSSIEYKLVDAKANEIGLNLGLGLSYFVSNDWAIEATWAGLGFTSNDNGGDGAEKTSTFGLGANLRAISFGVVYKF